MNPKTLGFSASAFLILSLTSPLPAQTTFRRTYGGEDFDGGSSVTQTADGGYVIAGHTKSFGAGDYDVWLIKTVASGDTIWTRTYGGTDEDRGYSVAQTTDGGYIIGGFTWSFGAGEEDVYLIKTDANGDTVWTRTYGGADGDKGYSVAQTADGGYVITGYTGSFGAGYQDVYLVKTNASGDTIWTRTHGGTSSERGYSMAQTTDGSYIITGYTWSFGAGHTDAWLIKTDALGDTMWTRTYGGTGYDRGWSVVQTADGGYVITGRTGSFGTGNKDVWLIRTDASGDSMWTRTYGGTDDDYGRSVALTADGGYVIASYTWSFGAGSSDVYLVKTDASGDTMWTRTFGGADSDDGFSVAQTADGGYVITGRTRSFGAGSRDIWLIKTDSAGRVAVATRAEPPIAHKPAPATIARAVLHVPGTSGILLDISGRKVMDLRPGPNDIRHIPPGAYFVRQTDSRDTKLSKVVVTH